MTAVKMLDEKVMPISRIPGGRLSVYVPKTAAEHVYSLSGETVRVKFKARLGIVSDLLDWLGQDVIFTNADRTEVTAEVTVNKRAAFCVALQYGQFMEVLEPLDLRDELKTVIKKMSDRYLYDMHSLEAAQKKGVWGIC